MTDRYIKIKQTQPITQDYIKSLENLMETIWTPDSFCFYSITFSDLNMLCVDYPTDLSRSKAMQQLQSMGLEIGSST